MIDIPATKSSPEIKYSEQENTLTISGESYPENSFAFFQPLFEWLHEQLERKAHLHVSINISYMNSSSTKCMLDFLDLLGDTRKHNCSIDITWQYERENDRALELAEEFQDEATVPFRILPYHNPDRHQ
jgi:hypothetical protein